MTLGRCQIRAQTNSRSNKVLAMKEQGLSPANLVTWCVRMGKISFFSSILILISLSVTCAYAAGDKVYTDEEVSAKNAIVYDNALNTPVNGILKQYFESGILKNATQYKNGKKDGVSNIYNRSGVLLWEIPFKDGEKNGVARKHGQTGALIAEIPFKEGKINGVEKHYYQSGKLKEEIPYTDNEINGVRKWYSESGELEKERLYKDDNVCTAKE